jgi:hypothetical protein
MEALTIDELINELEIAKEQIGGKALVRSRMLQEDNEHGSYVVAINIDDRYPHLIIVEDPNCVGQ